MSHPLSAAPRVLLVDDHPAIRNALSGLLQAAGFEPQEAEDGIDGVEKLRAKVPDVIISDLRMPRMSGGEFISVVRRRFPQIPVIVLSAASRSELPPEAQPDVWFEKGELEVPKLVKAVRTLARKTSRRRCTPKVIGIPARPRPDVTGYVALTCTDCLRSVRLKFSPADIAVERTASCEYCHARLRFLVEGAEPD